MVKTIGLQISAVGITLITAASTDLVTLPVVVLGLSSSIVFSCIDLIYVAKKEISPVYLADALVELGFAAGWVFLL